MYMVQCMANVLGHHCDYGEVMYFDVFCFFFSFVESLAGDIALLLEDLSGQKLN